MEEILIRFPVLGEKIFKGLDDKNLVEIRKVGKNWCTFLDILVFMIERTHHVIMIGEHFVRYLENPISVSE